MKLSPLSLSVLTAFALLLPGPAGAELELVSSAQPPVKEAEASLFERSQVHIKRFFAQVWAENEGKDEVSTRQAAPRKRVVRPEGAQRDSN